MRWAIEVTHYNCKQHSGLEDPANRTQKAVERTAPMSMFLYSMTIVWFAVDGHQNLKLPNRPWYPRKAEPSFADMLTTLRRKTWDEQFPKVSSEPTPHNISIEMLKSFLSLAGQIPRVARVTTTVPCLCQARLLKYRIVTIRS